MPNPIPRPAATISAIAAEVGVSVPTVSKVLNGRSDVAPGTRARVEAALARHRYKRRPRRPATAGPPLLDLAFHELDSAWAIEIVRGVETTAAAAGVGVVLSELGGAHRPQQEWVDAVLAAARRASSSCCPRSGRSSSTSWRAGPSRSWSSTPPASYPVACPPSAPTTGAVASRPPGT